VTRAIIVAFALFLVALCPATEPTKAPTQPGKPALEFVLLGDDRIARIEVHVERDGKPIAATWDETFARLLTYFDSNGDGILDAKEVAELPSPISLRHAMGSGFTPPVGSAPAFADLDADKDGKVTLDELSHYYRRTGLGGVMVGFGKLPSTEELTDALLKNLDADGDGKVTEKEWRAAADSLKKLDKNDDELIRAGELVPKAAYPGAAGTALLVPPSPGTVPPESMAKLPVILLPADPGDIHWAREIIRRRGRDGDQSLSLLDSGLSKQMFKKLDGDNDGKLSAEELIAWRKQEADSRWHIRLETKPAEQARFLHTTGRLRFEGWLTEGKMKEASTSARRQIVNHFEGIGEAGEAEAPRPRRGGNLAWLTPIADRNKDGKLTRKEVDSWLELQEQIARGQVMITLLDGGSGLFELLDTNHDGALSVRELRCAWERVREAGLIANGEFNRSRCPHTLLAAISWGYPQTFGIDMKRGPAWFQAMDRNGDGDVSRREFTGPPEVFDKLDLNKDGLIDAEEAEKAGKKK
jgi:Ca2+-binding EF-hand superfamily protein